MLCAIKLKFSNNELIFDKYCSSKRKIEFDWDFRTENLIRATILIRQNVNFFTSYYSFIILYNFCIKSWWVPIGECIFHAIGINFDKNLNNGFEACIFSKLIFCSLFSNKITKKRVVDLWMQFLSNNISISMVLIVSNVCDLYSMPSVIGFDKKLLFMMHNLKGFSFELGQFLLDTLIMVFC